MMKRFTLEEAKAYRRLHEDEVAYVESIGFTLSPSIESGFEEVTYYGHSLKGVVHSSKRPEWIYVLSNKHIPGILKIGYTRTSVNQRVIEINAPTGVVYPWFPVFSYKCANGFHLEQEIHRYLEGLGIRINDAREGFQIEIDEAIEVIERLGNRYRMDELTNL